MALDVAWLLMATEFFIKGLIYSDFILRFTENSQRKRKRAAC